MASFEKTLEVTGTHLLVPVSNAPKGQDIAIDIFEGDQALQRFHVALPKEGEVFWMAAYPLDHLGIKEKTIRLANADKSPEMLRSGFDKIHIGSASEVLAASDYTQPYRNQFHASVRRGWVNDPNGMVYSAGKYHLYFQHNPFAVKWGRMHWGHLESPDLIHWEEKPIALYPKGLDAAFSGNGFVDFNNSAGLGEDTQFAAYTSTRRGECIIYSKDGGLTFKEIEENPVVKHNGRDPFVLWYEPEQKWVMAVFDLTARPETDAVSPAKNIAFYESKNLRQWTRTGAFTDPDRQSIHECPGLFELPVMGQPGQSRWLLHGAANRYFIGQFDGKTFTKEAGPLGTTHGAFYAAQTFSNAPDGRRIQIGWLRTHENYLQLFPDLISSQAFSLPHELTLRETPDGLRVFFWPVKELEQLRGEVLAEGKDLTEEKTNELLQKCQGELSEILIEFSGTARKPLIVNGIDATFSSSSARIFNDRTFNEVYVDDGISYEVHTRPPAKFDSKETLLKAGNETVRSLKIYRLKSIWPM